MRNLKVITHKSFDDAVREAESLRDYFGLKAAYVFITKGGYEAIITPEFRKKCNLVATVTMQGVA